MATASDRPLNDLYNFVYDQALLVFSWHYVAGKKGARQAGVDRRDVQAVGREGVENFLRGIQEELWGRTYRPAESRRWTIGSREFCIRTVADRIVEHCLLAVLSPIFTWRFHPNSFAYQQGKGGADAISLLAYHGRNFDTYLRLDIRSFFDLVLHRRVIKALKVQVRDGHVLDLVHEFMGAAAAGPGRGIGQGTFLSPFLSNVVLDPLDWLFPVGAGYLGTGAIHRAEALVGVTATATVPLRPPAKASSVGRLTGSLPVLFVRYSDDIIVLMNGGQAQAEHVLRVLRMALESLGLEANDKTVSGSLYDGVDFLGLNIRRNPTRPRVRVTIAQSKVQEMKGDIEAVDAGSREVRDRAVRRLHSRLDAYASMGADVSDASAALLTVMRERFGHSE